MRALAADLPEGSAPHASRLAALERAGRAIDATALSRQPEAIQHYFRHAVACIRILSRSTPRQRVENRYDVAIAEHSHDATRGRGDRDDTTSF